MWRYSPEFLPHVLCSYRYKSFYPEGGEKSQSFGRIISPGHFERIAGLLKNSKVGEDILMDRQSLIILAQGTIVAGGETDAATKYIAPTIVKDVKPDDSLMSECIFSHCLALTLVWCCGKGTVRTSFAYYACCECRSGDLIHQLQVSLGVVARKARLIIEWVIIHWLYTSSLGTRLSSLKARIFFPSGLGTGVLTFR